MRRLELGAAAKTRTQPNLSPNLCRIRAEIHSEVGLTSSLCRIPAKTRVQLPLKASPCRAPKQRGSRDELNALGEEQVQGAGGRPRIAPLLDRCGYSAASMI